MEIPKVNLDIGNEKRFVDFISNIDAEDKVALISHTDLDGITAAKIVNEVIDANQLFFVSYDKLVPEFADQLKDEGFNKIIFTDLYIKDETFIKKLESFSNTLIIDHHPSPDWNSEKTICIKCEPGFSAGYLCYHLFSKIKSLEYLDWLVACSCISDYCHVKPEKWLEKIYSKYGDVFEREGHYVRKTGKFWDLQYSLSLALIYFRDDLKKVFDSIGDSFGEIGDLKKYSEEIKAEINKYERFFDEEKEEFEKGYFLKINPKFSITGLVINVISNKYDDKVIIMISPKDEIYKVSVRRQDGKFDCGKFIETILKGMEGASGGGHPPAAGGRFLKKDLPEFRKKLGLD